MTADDSTQASPGNPTKHDVSRRYRQRSPLPSTRSPRSALPSPTDRFLMAASRKHSDPIVNQTGIDKATQTEMIPPASSSSALPVHDQAGRRSRSPTRNPDMVEEPESLKKEAPSDVEMRSPESTIRAPSEAETTQIPIDQHPRMHFHHHQLPPCSHGPVRIAGALLRQQVLFERLLSICTYAVRRYVVNQVRPRMSLGLLLDTDPRGGGLRTSGPATTTTRRYHPYNNTNNNNMQQRLRTLPSELRLLIRRGPSSFTVSNNNSPNLFFSYILPIADRLWTQARSSPLYINGPQPAPIEAAHRMHNLYVWAGRVVRAVETVRAGELVRDEEAFHGPVATVTVAGVARSRPRSRRGAGLDAISLMASTNNSHNNVNDEFNDDGDDDNNVVAAVLAARDICGWCLCEEGQRAVEEAWSEWVIAEDDEEEGMKGWEQVV